MFSHVQISEDIVNCIQGRQNEKKARAGFELTGGWGVQPPVHDVTPQFLDFFIVGGSDIDPPSLSFVCKMPIFWIVIHQPT